MLWWIGGWMGEWVPKLFVLTALTAQHSPKNVQALKLSF